MTSKQKLKQLLNTPELIQLLQNEQWNELMSKLPIQTRPVLLELLRDCGVGEKEVNELQLKFGIMFGLKTDHQTVAINSPTDDIYNVGVVANAGMQGGRQLGFISSSAAKDFSYKLDKEKHVSTHVYTMQPQTVNQYTWVEVDTIFGKAWTTTHAQSKFVGKYTIPKPWAKQEKLLRKKQRELKDMERYTADYKIYRIESDSVQDEFNKIDSAINTLDLDTTVNNQLVKKYPILTDIPSIFSYSLYISIDSANFWVRTIHLHDIDPVTKQNIQEKLGEMTRVAAEYVKQQILTLPYFNDLDVKVTKSNDEVYRFEIKFIPTCKSIANSNAKHLTEDEKKSIRDNEDATIQQLRKEIADLEMEVEKLKNSSAV